MQSVMYRKSMQRTSSAGLISDTRRHSGLASLLAHRSQTAFTTAAVARWMAPLSGPIQRSWLSEVTCLQNRPGFSRIQSRSRPTTQCDSASMALQTISLPRPMVKVSP